MSPGLAQQPVASLSSGMLISFRFLDVPFLKPGTDLLKVFKESSFSWVRNISYNALFLSVGSLSPVDINEMIYYIANFYDITWF